MSNTSATSMLDISEGFSPPRSIIKRWRRTRFLWIPLLACFLITVIARIWLTIHTHGVISGDEALVGIQAEHILRGEHPIYYYSQPYMGSLQAYFLAGIFLFTGPSVWAMRAEPILISLVFVYLTWLFSAALADAAHVPPRSKFLFMTIATLVAALPPLYDMIEEMRAKGGYTEAITIMLWLLLCAFRLTQRWHEGASTRELALRWAGIGFLLGLGLWVDPIVVYAILTIALWIGGYVILEFVKPSRQTASQPRVTLIKETLLAVVALPASLVGFAPGLVLGSTKSVGEYSLSLPKRWFSNSKSSSHRHASATDLYHLPGSTRSWWSITNTTRSNRGQSTYHDVRVSRQCRLYCLDSNKYLTFCVLASSIPRMPSATDASSIPLYCMRINHLLYVLDFCRCLSWRL